MNENETSEYQTDDDFRDPIARVAREDFGIPYLFPWQRLVIANILDAIAWSKANGNEIGADSTHPEEDDYLRGRQIVLLPTGAGKSLCFQLPALTLERATLVVFPLLALQADQRRRLAERGIEAAFFRGSQTMEEREAQFARLEGRDGKPPAKIIIANPEILDPAGTVIERIEKVGIDHLAIDEAHCVAEWGDTFRPAYLKLGEVIARLKPTAVTAFTATASPPVLARVAEALFGGAAHVVRGESDRPNIAYSVYRCRAKDPALIREVARRKRPLVVFCATRGGTERAARLLREAFDDEAIRFYHAGLLKEEKIEVETWFHAHDGAILCATCAWGLGIDKKNVRTVIHRDPPGSAEAYAQESGRAGRDGEAAEAVLLWSADDARRARERGKTPRDFAMSEFAESGNCRRLTLLEALGDPKADKGAVEQIACSGCDVCAGSAKDEELDAKIAIDFVRMNRGAFKKSEVEARLYAAATRHAIKAKAAREWKRSDMAAMVESLVADGSLREIETGPWKGRLTLPKRGIPP